MARDLESAYLAWEDGLIVPALITIALDNAGLYGPDVDRACLAAEPDVDKWEAGERYPTWEQFLALADLTRRPPWWFVNTGRRPLTVWDTTLVFHDKRLRGTTPVEPVMRFDRAAVDATVHGRVLSGYQPELF
jgi:hypothetical protein